MRVLFGIPLEPRPGWQGWRAWRRGLVLRWGFGLRLYDADCALKLFRRSVFERIPVQSDGAFAHTEVLAKEAAHQIVNELKKALKDKDPAK